MTRTSPRPWLSRRTGRRTSWLPKAMARRRTARSARSRRGTGPPSGMAEIGMPAARARAARSLRAGGTVWRPSDRRRMPERRDSCAAKRFRRACPAPWTSVCSASGASVRRVGGSTSRSASPNVNRRRVSGAASLACAASRASRAAFQRGWPSTSAAAMLALWSRSTAAKGRPAAGGDTQRPGFSARTASRKRTAARSAVAPMRTGRVARRALRQASPAPSATKSRPQKTR